jgi:NADH:ubiquinone oxidoreductase subunit E
MEKIRFENLVGPDGKTIELDLPSVSQAQAQERWDEINNIRAQARRSAKEVLSMLRRINKRQLWLEQRHINARSLNGGI